MLSLDRSRERLRPLLAEFSVRGLTIANRFVMAPMTRNFSPGGVPGDDVAGYYERRAKGGVGLIVTEGVGIDHVSALGDAGLAEFAVPVLHGEAFAAWRKVVDRVHAAGGKIMPQLWHQGPMRLEGTGNHPAAPSMRPSGIWGMQGQATIAPSIIKALEIPSRPMSEADIADVVAAYGRSARNAVAASFDGIALHGAHGYLLDAFLWAGCNLRVDRWGGDAVRRTRFAVEVIREVRRNIDEDMPISFRFSQWKQQDYQARIAASPKELEQILCPLADAGVDMFDASARRYSDAAFEGSPLSLAGWTRRVTGKPCGTVGGVGLSGSLFDAARGESVAALDDFDLLAGRFEQGEFDLVSVGRALLQTPDWVRALCAGEPLPSYNSAVALTQLI
jgi:2,4-dienoyl-CoA reductase-like NADH-dependent reductase (Old Yellow Enzyme family)